MCWSETPKGVFDSQQAIEIGKELEGLLDKPTVEAEHVDENTSDGYHAFKELYEFRKFYNAALFNEWADLPGNPYDVHKSPPS